MSAVLEEIRGPVLWLSINRPDKRNAISLNVLEGLLTGLRRAREEQSIRAVVITGVGDKSFCAGGDMQPGGGFSFDFDEPRAPLANLIRVARDSAVPIVARINGSCVAGGMGLLAMADLAVAADHAVFGLPEIKVGLFPFQVLALLQTIVPPRTVAEWCLTGETFDAATALSAGILNYVVPADALDAKVEWLLSRLVDKSSAATARGKYALAALADMTFAGRLAFAESQLPLATFTDDAQEGLAAFNEKRKPLWKADRAD
jgi:methylglutaconyl-CoA hydratase